MSGFKSSCRIKPNAAGDWQLLPPAGEWSQIGDGVPLGAAADEDDLYISGKLEVEGFLYVTGTGPFNAIEAYELFMQASAFIQLIDAANDAIAFFTHQSEEITVAVGTGAAGVWGAAGLNAADSIMLGVSTRISQAPGGGATLVSVGRSTNIDEYVDDGTVGMGDTADSATDGDGVNLGPVYNSTARVMKVTTNNNVTISDMIIRVTTYYIKFYPPSS